MNQEKQIEVLLNDQQWASGHKPAAMISKIEVRVNGQTVAKVDELPEVVLKHEPEMVGAQVKAFGNGHSAARLWTRIGPGSYNWVCSDWHSTQPPTASWNDLIICEVISPKEEPKVLTEQEEPKGVGAMVMAICQTCKASGRPEEQYYIRHRFTNVARWVCDSCGVTLTWGQLKEQLSGYIYKGLAAGDEQSPES